MPAQEPKRAQSDLGMMERGEAGPPLRIPTSQSEPAQDKHSWESSVDKVPVVENPTSSAKQHLIDVIHAVRHGVVFNDGLRALRRAEPPAGYPRLAEFLGSDERWLMFRRFSHLQVRLLLEKQAQMEAIEEDLHQMDMADKEDTQRQEEKKEGSGKLFTRNRRDPKEAAERRKLFVRLETTFKEYAELLDVAHKLATLEKPATYEWKSVRRFLSTAKPVVKREEEYIDWKEDLVTLRGEREHAVLGAIVEMFINYVKRANWLNPPQTMQKWLAANTFSEKVASVFISIFLLLLIPLLFVVPIYALHMIGNHIGKSIGVLIGFAVGFTCFLRASTVAKPHEVLGLAAGYLAVLVVFFGSVNNANPSRGSS